MSGFYWIFPIFTTSILWELRKNLCHFHSTLQKTSIFSSIKLSLPFLFTFPIWSSSPSWPLLSLSLPLFPSRNSLSMHPPLSEMDSALHPFLDLGFSWALLLDPRLWLMIPSSWITNPLLLFCFLVRSVRTGFWGFPCFCWFGVYLHYALHWILFWIESENFQLWNVVVDMDFAK